MHQVKKVLHLARGTKKTPTSRTGKPEASKYERGGAWSCRINSHSLLRHHFIGYQ
ncbi:MAG: type II toxin-antitoxin system YoeB family toxin [Odoribacteraceae bacterium]|nr:type II toxin-antitoxin system YoeB family toxin [Odoribacteraceae bacterium]